MVSRGSPGRRAGARRLVEFGLEVFLFEVFLEIVIIVFFFL